MISLAHKYSKLYIITTNFTSLSAYFSIVFILHCSFDFLVILTANFFGHNYNSLLKIPYMN